MARKYGKVYKMSEKFEDYSYIINGVGGIGKTTLVYEIGKIITGSNEGTFIITCGGENKPKHIPDAFGDVALDFKTFISIVKELCDNKEEYPFTRFIAIDSLDEYARLAENYVVAEYNATVDINERVKSVAQAYKGFQKGENRATDLMIQQIVKLQNAGYSILEIGHTKTKTKEDEVTKLQYEQLTCNLDNKYYNALKDKVNLVCMCRFENTIENLEERKNAFTKKKVKVGELTDRKRVMIFADDDNAIDCKSHFEYITYKIDFSADGFIQAVEDAIAQKIAVTNSVTPTHKKKSTKKLPVVEEPEEESVAEDELHVEAEAEAEADVDNAPFDLDDELETVSPADVSAHLPAIRVAFKSADVEIKKQVKAVLADNGGKLSEDMSIESVLKIEEILGM